jgi:hypothetical protein
MAYKARSTSNLRPNTAQSFSGTRRVRRYQQIANVAWVPVVTFHGAQDLPNNNALLGLSGFATATSARSREAPPTIDSVLSDPDCQKAADDIEHISQLETGFLRKLAEYLRLLAQNSASKGDYPTALDADAKRSLVLVEYHSRRIPRESSPLIGDQQRLIKERRDQWAREVHDFDEETQRQISEMHQRFQEEMNALDEEWQTKQVNKYRKPSAFLIRQRIVEADSIHRDQIERAAFVHSGVKTIEEREWEQANERFHHDWKDAKLVLLDLQNSNFAIFSSNRGNSRDLLMRKIEKQEIILGNRLRVLYQKPPPLPPYKLQYEFEPIDTRPKVDDSQIGEGPGAKLPMLDVSDPLSTPPKQKSPSRASTDSGQATPPRKSDSGMKDIIKDTVKAKPQQNGSPVVADVVKETAKPKPQQNSGTAGKTKPQQSNVPPADDVIKDAVKDKPQQSSGAVVGDVAKETAKPKPQQNNGNAGKAKPQQSSGAAASDVAKETAKPKPQQNNGTAGKAKSGLAPANDVITDAVKAKPQQSSGAIVSDVVKDAAKPKPEQNDATAGDSPQQSDVPGLNNVMKDAVEAKPQQSAGPVVNDVVKDTVQSSDSPPPGKDGNPA